MLVDESVGWAREQVFGPAGEIQGVAQGGPEGSAVKRKAGWRKGEVKWEDGGVAGGLMGLVVGTACEYIYIHPPSYPIIIPDKEDDWGIGVQTSYRDRCSSDHLSWVSS